MKYLRANMLKPNVCLRKTPLHSRAILRTRSPRAHVQQACLRKGAAEWPAITLLCALSNRTKIRLTRRSIPQAADEDACSWPSGAAVDTGVSRLALMLEKS